MDLEFDLLNYNGEPKYHRSVNELNRYYVNEADDRVILTSEQALREYQTEYPGFNGDVEELAKRINFNEYDILLVGNEASLSSEDAEYIVSYIRTSNDTLNCFLTWNHTSCGDALMTRMDFMVRIPKIDSSKIQYFLREDAFDHDFEKQTINYF